MSLADLLISLANYKIVDGCKVLSVAKDFPTLKKAFPLEIQVPAGLHRSNAPLVKLESMLDRVDVIMSMQKPKKITFKGSDGRSYSFLCKPNDDLRKDYRMVELFDLMNDLFKQHKSSLGKYMGSEHHFYFSLLIFDRHCSIQCDCAERGGGPG